MRHSRVPTLSLTRPYWPASSCRFSERRSDLFFVILHSSQFQCKLYFYRFYVAYWFCCRQIHLIAGDNYPGDPKEFICKGNNCPVEASLFPNTINPHTKEGANKQVISSQADSLIKISRIWADFFPANTSNQPI